MADSTIEIRKRGGFSHVPDAILENKLLSLDTRAVLGWLVGRPEGWTIRVEWMRARLGISEFQWKRIKNEMARRGYFTQEKRRAKDGKIEWVQIVSEEPTLQNATREKLTLEKLMDGGTMHGGVGDYSIQETEESKQRIKTTTEPPAPLQDGKSHDFPGSGPDWKKELENLLGKTIYHEFEENARGDGKPITQARARHLCNKLRRLGRDGHSIAEVANHAVRHFYHDFYPVTDSSR